MSSLLPVFYAQVIFLPSPVLQPALGVDQLAIGALGLLMVVFHYLSYEANIFNLNTFISIYVGSKHYRDSYVTSGLELSSKH